MGIGDDGGAAERDLAKTNAFKLAASTGKRTVKPVCSFDEIDSESIAFQRREDYMTGFYSLFHRLAQTCSFFIQILRAN